MATANLGFAPIYNSERFLDGSAKFLVCNQRKLCKNALSDFVIKHVFLTVTHHTATNPINKIAEQKFFLPNEIKNKVSS
mgnify:CR=1 FL=1